MLSRVRLFTTPWTVEARLLCPWNFPARILEWVAISFSRWSSWARDQIPISCDSCDSCVGRWILYLCHLESPDKVEPLYKVYHQFYDQGIIYFTSPCYIPSTVSVASDKESIKEHLMMMDRECEKLHRPCLLCEFCLCVTLDKFHDPL